MGVCFGKQHEKPGKPPEPEKTSVWWDIENCRPPSDVNPFDISRNMSLALNCKGPLSISAYGDINQFSKDVQNALTSTGISLHHIPSGKKDASDKAILVNMAFWSQDNPPPANIMLISGDVDFSGILHQLRMRKFNVLLARPEGVKVSDSLTNAASTVWYWSRLARGEIRDLETPRKMHISKTVDNSKTAESSLVKSAIFKLMEELMLPTEINIYGCIVHDKKQKMDFSKFKSLLDAHLKEGNLEVSVSEDKQVYVPRGVKLWDCMDENVSRKFHPGVWDELRAFLTGSSTMVQEFERSSCQYQAALVVRKHGKFSALSLGEICSLMQQARLKSWIKPDSKSWYPLRITMKQVEGSNYFEDEHISGVIVRSTDPSVSTDSSKKAGKVAFANPATNARRLPSNDTKPTAKQLMDLEENCRELLKDKAKAGDYPLSNLKSDFQKKFGYALDHCRLGFPKLTAFILSVDEHIEIQPAAPAHPHKLVSWNTS